MISKYPREPFRLFQTVEEELSASGGFWWSRTSAERMEYLEHLRIVEYGEEAVNAPVARCCGGRKLNEPADPSKIVWF